MKRSKSMTYLAFSGGGWNSHTVLAATFSAGLQKLREESTEDIPAAMKRDFEDLFSRVKSISSNSGGSWFLTMLAYSKPFQESLEDHSDQWFNEGYMGQMNNIFLNGLDATTIKADEVNSFFHLIFNKKIFKEVSSYMDKQQSMPSASVFKKYFAGNREALHIYRLLRRVDQNRSEDIEIGELLLGKNSYQRLSNYTNNSNVMLLGELMYLVGLARLANQTNLSWNTLNHDLTFKPFDMNNELKSVRMSSEKNKWASDIDLLISSTLLTQSSVLNSSLDQFSAKVINGPKQYAATPFLISSLSGAGFDDLTSLTAGDFKLIYKPFKHFKNQYLNTDLNSAFKADLPVLDATAASSAAIGMLASFALEYPEEIGKKNIILTDILRNYAVAGYFPSGNDHLELLQGKEPASPTIKLDELMDDRYVRLADGAYFDNSSAAYHLSAMQQNGDNCEFELTLFVNSSVESLPLENLLKAINADKSEIKKGRPYSISNNLAELFGFVNNSRFDYVNPTASFVEEQMPGVEYRRMSTTIFEPSAFVDKVPEWQYEGTNNDTLINYWNLDVKTVANPSIGVKGGYEGTIKVFENMTPSSSSAPYTVKILEGYQDVYDATQDAYLTGGGWSFLKEAIGFN